MAEEIEIESTFAPCAHERSERSRSTSVLTKLEKGAVNWHEVTSPATVAKDGRENLCLSDLLHHI